MKRVKILQELNLILLFCLYFGSFPSPLTKDYTHDQFNNMRCKRLGVKYCGKFTVQYVPRFGGSQFDKQGSMCVTVSVFLHLIWT